MPIASGRKPPRYHPFGYQAEVFTPLVVDPSDPNFTKMGELNGVARVAPRANAHHYTDELEWLHGVKSSSQCLRGTQVQGDGC